MRMRDRDPDVAERGPRQARTAAPRRSGAPARPDGPLTTASVQRLQAHGGNRAVQELLAARAGGGSAKAKPKAPGQDDKLEEEKAKGKGGPVQRDLSETTAAVSGAITGGVLRIVNAVTGSVTPNFVLQEPSPKRSNDDASTTSGEPPTFTGKVYQPSEDVYGYKLTTVTARGTIQIVYYDKDHYPAPFADWWILSNVTKDNWEEIRDDLRDNRTGIADDWCAYDAEVLHEDYHWRTEWQPRVEQHVAAAEGRIAGLSTGAQGVSSSDAEKLLEPQAEAIFTEEMTAARASWNALGDEPGDPPYIAQAPAIDKLRERVEKKAAGEKWP